MTKITGLDELQKQLKEAQRALEAIDGELTTISFNPDDPESIEGAIRQTNEAIDSRVGPYASNPFVEPLIEQMKDHYRQAILDRAAEARLEDSDGDDE